MKVSIVSKCQKTILQDPKLVEPQCSWIAHMGLDLLWRCTHVTDLFAAHHTSSLLLSSPNHVAAHCQSLQKRIECSRTHKSPSHLCMPISLHQSPLAMGHERYNAVQTPGPLVLGLHNTGQTLTIATLPSTIPFASSFVLPPHFLCPTWKKPNIKTACECWKIPLPSTHS